MNTSIGYCRQQGAALFVSLIMLLVMTLIIVSGARSSALEIMLADNAQNAQQALMRAENSVLEGNETIEENFDGAPTFDFGASEEDGYYVAGELALDTVDWKYVPSESEGEGDNLREYIIEYLGPAAAVGGGLGVGIGVAANTRYLYRVSGRGISTRSSARVVQVVLATAE
jgi:Tfp pilus assembly protein PilX